jgi:Cu-processing system ATP-binding protein
MTDSLTLMLPQPLLEVSEVSKSFGRLPVLRRVSFGIRAGRITAILGPNAAGKSTVIKTILGLTRADSGRIVVNGNPVSEDPGYRAGIGYMPQAAPFPENLTGREVLAMLRELREEAGEDTGLLRELELEGDGRLHVSSLPPDPG